MSGAQGLGVQTLEPDWVPVCLPLMSCALLNLSSLSVPIWEMGTKMTDVMGWQEAKELTSVRHVGRFLAHSLLSMCYYYDPPWAEEADFGLTFKDGRKTASGAPMPEPGLPAWWPTSSQPAATRTSQSPKGPLSANWFSAFHTSLRTMFAALYSDCKSHMLHGT